MNIYEAVIWLFFAAMITVLWRVEYNRSERKERRQSVNRWLAENEPDSQLDRWDRGEK